MKTYTWYFECPVTKQMRCPVNACKESARVTGCFLRFSPSAGSVELAALRQPQTQLPPMAAMLGP
ncbi:hypothetical protein DSCA_39850 [Desulfosarcina alkanivorans]|uniref:Uncharacterized protein n=1 Tax=Desulfosarcina alkanivorans TaxID=571177 RepID=A0A5K7YP17_9BACT|nr:hypothetical protein DSCA_39850 [Desulfosarcina alkanivorans]